MKKSIYYIGIALMCAGSFMPSNAQELSTKQERMLKAAALNRLDEYRAYHSMGDEEIYYNFLDLFANDSCKVYNDQLGLGGKDQITVKEYADRQRNKLHAPQFFFSNIRIGRIWKDGESWKIELTYNKSASYVNACGIQFSTKDFYENEFEEKAIMEFPSDMKKCKILSINGSIDSKRKLAENYIVYLSTSERDSQLVYSPKNGGPKQKLKFNSFGQMLFEQGVSVNEFKYSDPDMTLKPVINEECHTMQMNYKARRWRLRPHYDVTIGDFYKIKTTDDKINSSSSGNEFGIDFGYTIPSKGIVKFSVNLGLGVATSKINLDSPEFNYSYETNEDVDGDTYLRRYQIGATDQAISLSHLNIPVYIDADFCFSRFVSMYVQAGLKNYMKMSAKIDSYNSSMYVDGLYRQYGNLVMNEHWGFNGFGMHQVSLNDVSDPDVHAKSFASDYFGGIGLRLKPLKSVPLALELGIQYQSSLSSILESDANSLILQNGVSASQAINSYTKADGEKYRMLSNGVNSLKRSHMKFNIGLVYKF